MIFQARTICFAGAFLFFGCITLATASAQTDRRIEEIRALYQETNDKIAESEADGETSSTYLTELIVNKNNGSYPAVGVYRSVVKFYYTYGNREKNPYPERLLKIMVTTSRAARTEYSEYLLNARGQLVFYFERKENIEKRFYFAAERPIQLMIADKQFAIEQKDRETVKTILAEKNRLTGIFQNSLSF